MTGMLGIGGSTVYNPLLIVMDIHPQVATATGMYIVLVGSVVNIIYYLGQGDWRTGYELVQGAIMLCAATSGIILANTMIKKLGRPSILVLLLALVVIISIVFIPIVEILKVLHDK